MYNHCTFAVNLLIIFIHFFVHVRTLILLSFNLPVFLFPCSRVKLEVLVKRARLVPLDSLESKATQDLLEQLDDLELL